MNWLHELSRRYQLPVSRLFLIGCGALLALIALFIIWRGIAAYSEALEDGKKEAERVAQIISDHTELTFLAADLTLRRAAERQYFNALFGNKLVEDVQNNFMVWVNQTPQISAMLMTDEKGQITAIYRKQGYKTWLEGREGIEREAYFRAQKEADGNDLLFAEPQSNWIGDGKFVLMSRRLNKLDGTFGGVVVAAVSSRYLTDFYESLKLPEHTKMLLFYEKNKKLLLGELDDPRDLEVVKKALDRDDVADKRHALIETKGADGNTRLLGYTNYPNLNIAIALVLHGDDIFAQWWAERQKDFFLLVGFTLFVGLLGSFALNTLRQVRRVERSEKTAVLASQAKSDFLANMSHELRTPLNAIIGFSEMLDSGYFGTLNSKQKERVHDIHMCGTHLLELINDILEFSKGAAGKLELKEEKINVGTLVAECTRFFSERAQRHKVDLVDIVPRDLPRIMADQRKIKQVLINLISNAVKFSHENGKVEISARMNEEGGITITVSDRGIGMAQEDIPKALSVFGQVHNAQGYEGTGLGLPLCKVFVELHGGRLKIESLKGVGTRVSIALPKSRLIYIDDFKVP